MSKIRINGWKFEHTMLPRQPGAGVDPSHLDQAIELAATNGDYASLVLGVANRAAAETAFDEILAAFRAAQPDATIDGCRVAPMVTGGVETSLGVQRDPAFGAIFMFGLGGIFVEALKDVTFRARTLRRGRGARHDRGNRGLPRPRRPSRPAPRRPRRLRPRRRPRHPPPHSVTPAASPPRAPATTLAAGSRLHLQGSDQCGSAGGWRDRPAMAACACAMAPAGLRGGNRIGRWGSCSWVGRFGTPVSNSSRNTIERTCCERTASNLATDCCWWPPGNGKTSLAESLAYELALPLFVVRYDAVVTSYLGETAQRLRRLFDFVRTEPCVLFFDEFDAIGEEGHAPWTRLFAMLDDLRSWGPEDRFSAEARVALEERLAEDEAAEHRLELEVWPTRSQERRERWRGEAERRVAALGGRVPSRSSIEEEGFIHEALLVALRAGSVRG